MLAWNTRGLNKKARHLEIAAHLNSMQMPCIALFETKVKRNNAERIRSKFGNKWNWIDNYNHHPNGRIWIMWQEENQHVECIHNSDQFIHYKVVEKKDKMVHWVTFIYAQNQLHHRRTLWTDIKQCNSYVQGPWIALGDFNNVLTHNDILGGQ